MLGIGFDEYNVFNKNLPLYDISEHQRDIQKTGSSCKRFLKKVKDITLMRIQANMAIRRIQRKWRLKAQRNLALVTNIATSVARLRNSINHKK